MSKILVTGASGRVGANLVKKLQEDGMDVRGFVMADDPLRGKLEALGCEIFEGNMLCEEDIERAMAGCEYIIHLAALIGRPNAMSEREYWDINVTASFMLVRAAGRKGIKRFIFASTDSIYSASNPQYSPIDENHPQNPFFLYSLTKKAAEAAVLEGMNEFSMPAVILRFSYVMANSEVLDYFRASSVADTLKHLHPMSMAYAPGQQDALERFQCLVNSPDALVVPKGPDLRSWRLHLVDVRDIVSGILLSLSGARATGEVFNLAGPHSTTWEQATKYISQKTGQPVTECVLDNYWGYEMNIQKAVNLLGFHPEYDIYRMIDDALAYKQGADTGVISAR